MERVVCLFKVELHVPDPLLPFTESVTFETTRGGPCSRELYVSLTLFSLCKPSPEIF